MSSSGSLRKLPAFLYAACSVTAFQQPALALTPSWDIDSEHSHVKFSVKHLMVSNVNGQFKTVSGTVLFDGKSLENASVNATIEAASIDTRMKLRDEHLKGKDSFDVVQFPAIKFKSNKIVPAADGSFKIFGTLSMHGISKDVVLQATALKSSQKAGEHRSGLTTTASAELNRKDFGITVDKAIDHGGAVIGEKVKISLDIALTKADDTVGMKNVDTASDSETEAQRK